MSSLSFLSPVFLLGLLAVALPVVIHLVGKRRAPLYKFSAIDFILRSQKRVESRLKLEHLLLLLLRIAIVSFLTLALARPVLLEKGAPLAASQAPSSNVLLVDNSYSMAYLRDGSSHLERARAWAKEVASSLTPEDEACVIPQYPEPEALPKFTPDKSDVIRSIGRVEPSYCTTDITSMLDKALVVLSGSKKQVQRVFLFTDLTKNGWREGELRGLRERLKDRPIRVHIIDVSEGHPLPNLAISALERQYDWTKRDGQVMLKTTVSNFTDSPVKNLPIEARFGERALSRGFLDIEPWSSGTKEFLLEPPKEGNSWGSVEIPKDRLPADDTRYFTLPVVKDMAVLVVDGAPSINIYQGETFYLERALNPARLHTSHIRPLVITPQELATLEFKNFDLVILSNVRELHHRKVSELERYVSEGGRVLFSLGDNVNPEYYNTTLAGLLPRLRTLVEFPQDQPLEFAPLETAHPILRVFAQERKAVLSTPHFYKVFMVEPEMGQDVSAIINYSNGAPALLELPYGKGRSMLLTSTVDRDWTDLPVKPIFLPLIQQVCRYLTGNLLELTSRDVLIGEPWELPLYEGKEVIDILDPGGDLLRPEIKGPDPGKGLVFSKTHSPGIYRLRRGESEMTSFAVNVDPREGNLGKIDKELLEGTLGVDKVGLSLSAPTKGAGGVIEGKRLWSGLLFCTLCLVALEALVSWRRPL